MIHNSIFSPKWRFWIPILSLFALFGDFLRTYSHVLRNLFAFLCTLFAILRMFFAEPMHIVCTVFAFCMHLLCPLFGSRSQFSTCSTQPLHSLFALRVRRTCIQTASNWCRLANLYRCCINAE